MKGNITYTCWMGMISSNIKVVADISNVSSQDSKQGNLGGGTGNCCSTGSKATKFANGKVPTDAVQVAKLQAGQQEVTITVNDAGYSPAVVVLQKGVQAKIKFNTEQLNSCNNVVVFPEYQGQLDLQKQTETPWLTPQENFTFQCWMGMLHGYVKVVDDINKVNLEAVKQEVQKYTPAQIGGCGGGNTGQ